MKFKKKCFGLLIAILCIYQSSLTGSDAVIKPVTPKASPEAVALLKFLYSISGKYTLTGQHNYPNIKDRNSKFASKYIGKTPVIFSTDMGFAKSGDKDSHIARFDIVKEVIKQHQLGSIITVCWHAVPPTADEPVTFRPLPGHVAPDSLASVQGQILDGQFQDLLTPGTKLYKHWCSQVDTIAFYLKKLQEAHVPIIWRPYHEMNGNWFWWGGRRGKYSTLALYRQLFDRLVNIHKINNLIWVWSMDRVHNPDMEFSKYYPGNKYLDILGLDVYGNDFNKTYYDSLMALSKGKLVTLGEVGTPPTKEILKNQPRWTYYVTWAGMVRSTSKKQYNSMTDGTMFLFQEDSAYLNNIKPYRMVCRLPELSSIHLNSKPDFTGTWIFNEDKSSLDNFGAGSLPSKMVISKNDNELNVQKNFIQEYADDRITDEKISLTGEETKSEMMNSPKTMKARWSDKGDTLITESKVLFNRGGNINEMILNENWHLKENGAVLSIYQYSKSSWGERRMTIVYDKQ
jgi:mannan endo-1,4-beta-mannosidase